MQTDRLTKSLLLVIALLLLGNLLTMFGKTPTPAYAQGRGAGSVSYKIIFEGSRDYFEATLNQEAKKGWRVKAALGGYSAILEK